MVPVTVCRQHSFPGALRSLVNKEVHFALEARAFFPFSMNALPGMPTAVPLRFIKKSLFKKIWQSTVTRNVIKKYLKQALE